MAKYKQYFKLWGGLLKEREPETLMRLSQDIMATVARECVNKRFTDATRNGKEMLTEIKKGERVFSSVASLVNAEAGAEILTTDDFYGCLPEGVRILMEYNEKVKRWFEGEGVSSDWAIYTDKGELAPKRREGENFIIALGRTKELTEVVEVWESFR